MNALIYCRVSKKEQNPQNQEIVLRRYAQERGWDIDSVYTDIITGKSSTRPELTKMLSRVREGGIDVVLVYKLDRMGRSVKHVLSILEELMAKKIDFVCATQPFDTTTSAGMLFFTIVAAFAEFERELISERVKAGFYTDEKGVVRSVRRDRAVGKRGKDHGKRKKRGYYVRDYSKKRPPQSSFGKNMTIKKTGVFK